MKKILFILLLPALAFASGWDNYSGTAMSPVVSGYYNYLQATDSIKTQLLAPRIANTGSIGASGNAFNAGYMDTVKTSVLTALSGKKISIPAADTFSFGNSYIHTADGLAFNWTFGQDRAFRINTSGINGNASFVGTLGSFGTGRGSNTFMTGVTGNNWQIALACSVGSIGQVKDTTNMSWLVNKNSIRGKATGSTITADTNRVNKGLVVGAGTMLLGIYTGNATGWTLENTVDTNVVSGLTATTRVTATYRGAVGLNGGLGVRTTVDSLFIACIAADTALLRAGSVDFDCHK